MGFAFGMTRVFSVLHAEVEAAIRSNQTEIQYVEVADVCYIDSQNTENKSYREYCFEKLQLVNPAHTADQENLYKKQIQIKAPYIKHSGFAEENECRLVFKNNNGELNKCIRYNYIKDRNLKYPYVVVKAALPDEQIEDNCVIRIGIQNDKEEILEEKIKKEVHLQSVQGCHLKKNDYGDTDEKFCKGCVLRQWQTFSSTSPCRYRFKGMVEYGYFLDDDVNEVVISQGQNQEEIFEKVHKCVQGFNREANMKVKVWCEGHLPLRKLTIGPCENQSSVVEAIKHYCKHTYWLRDVEIVASNIPYRKSL